MVTQTYQEDQSASPRPMLRAALWVVQILLAAFFGFAGYSKTFMPPDALVAMGMAWVDQAPVALLRFIGIAELAGAAGIVLPALTRILPGLTPTAALGFTLIQVLAMLMHAARGEFAVLPVNVVVLSLTLFVAWGRFRAAPIEARR